MPARRLTAARLVRSVLNLFYYAGFVLATMAFLGTILVGITAPDRLKGDVAVRVAIGDNSFLPITRLASESPVALTPPALARGIAELRFESADGMLVLVSMSAILTGIVLLLIFVRVLRGMLDRVLDGRPFDPANVRALHLLAFLSVAGPIALQVLQYGVARHVLSVVEVQGIDLSPPFDLDLTPFFVALLLEALASVFSHGADLETDRSLTI